MISLEKNAAVLTGALLCIGLVVAGWFVGNGFLQGRAADRYVTVKGISERDVRADIALWPLSFVATDDDLDKAQQAVRRNHQQVLAFLERHGIDPQMAEVQKLDVKDRLADPYRSGPAQSRYIITQTVMVRSKEPETIAKASQAVGELVDAGVILSATGMAYNGPTFLFTRLNEYKPEMIAEATAEARRAAEQFAQDSGSRLGGIRRANQGGFVILARDRAPGIIEENQLDKTLRVVSTVEYLLEN